jgi:hypothetical protein
MLDARFNVLEFHVPFTAEEQASSRSVALRRLSRCGLV